MQALDHGDHAAVVPRHARALAVLGAAVGQRGVVGRGQRVADGATLPASMADMIENALIIEDSS